MANEKRLIDANELLKVLKHRVKGNEDSGIVLGVNSNLEIMEQFVRSIPTVDAVEVVRCKECKMYCPESITVVKHCTLTGVQTDNEDFCSYGERECNGR